MKEAAKWDVADACAQRIILDWIANTYWVFVATATTANEIWLALERAFEKDAKLIPVYAITALFGCTWDEGTKLLDKLLRFMQEHVNELHQFKGSVTDLIGLIHVLVLIKSLPPSWSQTVNMIMATDIPDYVNVVQTIKRTIVLKDSGTGLGGKMALLAKAGKRGKGKGNNKPK